MLKIPSNPILAKYRTRSVSIEECKKAHFIFSFNVHSFVLCFFDVQYAKNGTLTIQEGTLNTYFTDVQQRPYSY